MRRPIAFVKLLAVEPALIVTDRAAGLERRETSSHRVPLCFIKYCFSDTSANDWHGDELFIDQPDAEQNDKIQATALAALWRPLSPVSLDTVSHEASQFCQPFMREGIYKASGTSELCLVSVVHFDLAMRKLLLQFHACF